MAEEYAKIKVRHNQDIRSFDMIRMTGTSIALGSTRSLITTDQTHPS